MKKRTERKKNAPNEEMNLVIMRERRVRYLLRPETSRAVYPNAYRVSGASNSLERKKK